MPNHIHTRGQFIDFVGLVFKDYQLTNSGINVQVTCPVCRSHKGSNYNKKKFAIETQTHINHCWSCGYKSRSLRHILKKYYPNFLPIYKEQFCDSTILEDELSRKTKSKEYDAVTLPDDFMLLATQPSNSTEPCVELSRRYLESRGITDESLYWYWKFGVSKRHPDLFKRIIVPSFDYRGNINYYSARTIDKEIRPKYFNPEANREQIIFNELNINWNEELTIVEGVFDLIKCNDNATCILGSSLSSDYKLFQKILNYKTPIVLALDPDAKNKTMKLAKRFHEFGIPIKIIDYPAHVEDVGSISKNQFMDLLGCAKIYNTEYLLKNKIASIRLD